MAFRFQSAQRNLEKDVEEHTSHTKIDVTLRNSGFGQDALDSVTSGTDNTALGQNALTAVLTTNASTAVGAGALEAATGANNTAVGSDALTLVVAGADNTAVGQSAGATVTTGSSNVFIGDSADGLAASANCVAIGDNADADGTGCIAIGQGAKATATNAIAIGTGATNAVASTCIIGISTAPIDVFTTASLTIDGSVDNVGSHLISSQTTVPTVAVDATNWTTPVIGASSTDMAGTCGCSVGANGVGTLTLTFDEAYAEAPIVTLTPNSAVTATYMGTTATVVYVTSTTTTFVINCAATGAGAQVLNFNYHVVGILV